MKTKKMELTKFLKGAAASLYIIGATSFNAYADDPDLTEAVKPVVSLIKSGTSALLLVFTAAMAILAIINAFAFAKAEDPQQKQVAKSRLTNLIIAFVIAFALMVVFRILDPILTTWVESTSYTAPTTSSTGP